METVNNFITGLFQSSNAYQVLIFLLLTIWTIAIFAKAGVLYFHNGVLNIGDGGKERNIIKRQQEWAFNYIMGLSKEFKYDDDNERIFCERILERVYDKVVEMIIYNNISDNPDYVENKKTLLKSTVYGFKIKEIYKTADFENKMDNWTEEIIHNLMVIRALWGKEFRK